MRTTIVEMFAQQHGVGRPYNVFQAHAPHALRERLGATLPQPTLSSAQVSLLRLLDIVEQEQAQLGMQLRLSDAHRAILEQVRQRQQSLHLAKD